MSLTLEKNHGNNKNKEEKEENIKTTRKSI